MQGRIVVCGNLVQDISVRPVSEPLPWGRTVIVDGVHQGLGGNGGTTSFTLGKLGVPVTLISLAGQDSVGNQLLKQLEAAGVTSQVERIDQPTSVAICMVDGSGGRALLYQLGASGGELSRPLLLPADASHLHVNAIYRMPHLRANVPEMLQQAKQSALSTSIDTQWDHLGEWMSVLGPALPWTDLLFVNEDEAWELTGLRDPSAAALALRDWGAGEVVVKLGARGSFASTAQGDFYSAANSDAVAVDTTGAGDVFVSAYLAALYREEPHREAARFANRIAGESVLSLGATAGL